MLSFMNGLIGCLVALGVAQEEDTPPKQDVQPEPEVRVGAPLRVGRLAAPVQANDFMFLQDDSMADPSRRDDLKRHFALKLRRLSRVCGLDEAQEKKLELVSKGVIDRHMTALEKAEEEAKKDVGENPVAQQVFQVFRNAQGGVVVEGGFDEAEEVVEVVEDPVVEEAEEVVEEVEAQDDKDKAAVAWIEAGDAADDVAVVDVVEQPAMGNFFINLAGAMHPEFSRLSSMSPEQVIQEDAQWNKTFTKVLTEEQRTTFDKSEKKRREFRIRTLASAAVLELDDQLQFTEEQRTTLIDWLCKGTKPEQIDRPTEEVNANLAVTLSQYSKEMLGKVLDPKQVEAWEKVAPGAMQWNRNFNWVAPQFGGGAAITIEAGGDN